MKVKDVMEPNVCFLNDEDTILHASKFMKEERIRNLPVIDKDKKLVGLITLREIIETIFHNPDQISVRSAMLQQEQMTCVKPDTSLKDAIEIMMANRFGCLPVIDNNGKLLGVISEANLLKVLHKYSSLPV
jgi:CBS domain-containing protein